MAGLQPGTPRPVEIKLHQKSRVLEISFDDGSSFSLPAEYLRVMTPSAIDRVLERKDVRLRFDRLLPAGRFEMDAEAASVRDLSLVRRGRPDHLDARFLKVPP